ncbi:MAG: acyl carrier protein [Gammaproteobacteria bacterium]|nr:acyl carrier protein [Gammaproteobacteria bacterium]
MGDLHHELKQMIIAALELEDIEPTDIVDDEPLFVEGLGLDSIDALEIGLKLQVDYGINLKADSEETRHHFTSINALAALVESQRSK